MVKSKPHTLQLPKHPTKHVPEYNILKWYPLFALIVELVLAVYEHLSMTPPVKIFCPLINTIVIKSEWNIFLMPRAYVQKRAYF